MGRLCLALCFCLSLGACAPEPKPAAPPLSEIPFDALPGWSAADAGPALAAFRRTCKRFARRDADGAASQAYAALGRNHAWAKTCATAQQTPPEDAKRFVIENFTAYRVGGADTTGVFTGYFEPEFAGARRQGGPYQTPIYRKPKDIVAADLGAFSVDLAGKTVLGRVVGNRFEPYHERDAITSGALAGQGLELAWLADPIDAFFLEIQGSGRILLPDGAVMQVGYAAKNGRPYRAIGRDLIERGAVRRADMSMQAIRRWLAANSAEAQAVMNLNRSYVFFEERTGPGPIGAAGTPLTAGYSLAVDPKFAPLGGLIYLDAPHPDAGAPPLRRLVVAEDTGGAIKGAVRGDLFWGTGVAAGALAGRMNSRGRYYLLAPRRSCGHTGKDGTC